ncbi:ferrous iron transport protein A [Xanthocytophaga flavus]|uniref:FeoA family protein n=1 Tax=Xanthocytophaga flava TaxID=3048013 RepID=UPI0028D080FE|nr:ferrous iron transport protein A [Xanthocytophaga flavus]
MESSQVKTIADLRKGETAIISRIVDNELALKLLEMGCLPGESVTLQHIAPLGDPICIRVSGYSLSLRKREASTIQLDGSQNCSGPSDNHTSVKKTSNWIS